MTRHKQRPRLSPNLLTKQKRRGRDGLDSTGRTLLMSSAEAGEV